MVDALEVLLEEHEIIMKAIGVLDQSTVKTRNGKELPSEFLEKFLDILQKFADKCHHGKEENALFPLIGQRSPNQSLTISFLLEDHQKARGFIAALKEAVARNDVEGKIRNADGYSRLLTLHIQRENAIFPDWMRMLDDKDKEDLFEKFEEIEEKVIGLGKHQEYERNIENLKSQIQSV